jgi:acetyl-CoA carboxylase biotin carboxylase subunit
VKIRRLLIANRGEIALRIIATCRRLGIECVLAASDADLDSVPARRADRVARLGAASPLASYLNVEAVIAAALDARADALHPGYGFLSENPQLAQRCRESGLVFVGPTEEQLALIGDKVQAREQARAAGLPLVPGGSVDSVADALELARAIGWPVLLKASGGGGGRGMKLVREPEAMADAFALAAAEAAAAFDDPRLYAERFVENGRHVEVQLLGDGRDVIHLGDRDCSIQRRYQKLLEEAPAPNLPPALRDALHAAAVAFGRRLGYRGAGTVEFLVDAAHGEFYFLEMNARIQVEHPVTEAITGLDLVAEQLSIAEGRPLRVTQGELEFRGHAIECRINAEDCAHDFRPSPGTVRAAVYPAGEGIRVDTHVETGSLVPPWYDSLLAKIIVHAASRDACLARLRAALSICRIEGVATNLPLHAALVDEPGFARGGLSSSYLGERLAQARAGRASDTFARLVSPAGAPQ